MDAPRPRPAFAAALFTALFLLPPSLQAALDFHTYRIKKEKVETTAPDGSKQQEIRTSYELTRLGSVTLEASSLTLTSHGSYLAVVEEATLSGNVENRPRDITYDFLLQGSLPIPPLAAVHSLSVLHGDTVFRASLRKATYSLNDVFLDTASLKATLDSRVVYLQQHSDRSFEACFTKLALGEPVRVRIEYDLPFPGAPGASIRVPVLFHPTGTPPRQSQITFFEKSEGLPPVQWLSPSGRVTLSSPGTHTVEYRNEYLFRRNEAPSTLATLQATAFEVGRIKGEYLLFKGGLNDSLMNLLSRPLEVVFLWRWNPPYNFVEVRNGLKTLSPLGEVVAQQARILRQVVKELGPRGHRFGLLHIAPGREEAFFAPGESGGALQDSLLDYLAGFDEAGLYAAYKDYKDTRLPWAAAAWDDSGEVRKGQEEFLSALRRVRAGFGDNADVLRHIALIGVGGAPTSLIDLKNPEPLAAILDSVTIANVNAAWPGVNLGEVFKLETNKDLRPLALESPVPGTPGILFPVFQPTSVEYRAFTASRSHAVVMPFSARAERQAVLKAETPFAD
ncbi:MAG TPA: hypothetical protein VK465_03715, partial [Fibrobacteria bacterium]|nr:hypothetical protein [Fibrobacteria bacterium]